MTSRQFCIPPHRLFSALSSTNNVSMTLTGNKEFVNHRRSDCERGNQKPRLAEAPSCEHCAVTAKIFMNKTSINKQIVKVITLIYNLEASISLCS